jgi:hypothetical protein
VAVGRTTVIGQMQAAVEEEETTTTAILKSVSRYQNTV